MKVDFLGADPAAQRCSDRSFQTCFQPVEPDGNESGYAQKDNGGDDPFAPAWRARLLRFIAGRLARSAHDCRLHQCTMLSVRFQRVLSKKWITVCAIFESRSAISVFLYWSSGVSNDQ